MQYKFTKEPHMLRHPLLKKELALHGLTLATVQDTLRQACVQDIKTRRNYHVFAFENDAGGWLCNFPSSSGRIQQYLGKKGITTFFNGVSSSVNVFNRFWDFYSWSQMNKDSGSAGSVILNSLSQISRAGQWLTSRKNTIKTVYYFADNTEQGMRVTQSLLDAIQSHDFVFGTKNHAYEPYRNISEFWVNSRNKS